ncbi:MAG: M48 family metallopeptidase [Acidobacteria bacterium]|nr:M48 family metallopeptidase [Acidobacteriota bacterium]
MIRSKCICPLLLCFVILLAAYPSIAQDSAAVEAKPTTAMPSVLTIPAEAQPGPHFNAEAATNAYLAQIPPGSTSHSDSYFEGGYWLILWDFLLGAVIYTVILRFRWSAAMRDVAERITRFKPIQTFIFWFELSVVSFVLGLPLMIYEGYVRERSYGLANQTFGPWMSEQLKMFLLVTVLGGLLATILLGIARNLPRSWWIWGSVVSVVFNLIVIAIAPVFFVPIFNKITRLDDSRVIQPILSMARANGIPAHDVYQSDASRQSKRMSANVSGFGSTTRITLNDNLLRRGSQEEIQWVMGHEMGHYVLHHVDKSMLFFAIVFVTFFGSLYWFLNFALARWGERWQIRGVDDVAVIPLVLLYGSVFFFVLTPIINTQIRTGEAEADIFGLNASRQPDGAAQAAIHLGEYRKMNPGPIEEWIFFDHPSGRNRIYAAMRWKAENQNLARAAAQ